MVQHCSLDSTVWVNEHGSMILRLLPNLLSAIRLVLAPLPLLIGGDRLAVFAVLAAGGLTDALDGPLARRLGVASKAGARLDSLADLAFFAGLAWWLILYAPGMLAAWWPLFAGVAAVRLAAALIGRLRHGAWIALHTWSNKLTGMAVFAALGVWLLGGGDGAVWIAGGPAVLAAVEELIILCRRRRPDPDIRGFWDRRPSGEPH